MHKNGAILIEQHHYGAPVICHLHCDISCRAASPDITGKWRHLELPALPQIIGMTIAIFLGETK